MSDMEPKEQVLGIDPAVVGGDIGATVYGYRKPDGSIVITRIEREQETKDESDDPGACPGCGSLNECQGECHGSQVNDERL